MDLENFDNAIDFMTVILPHRVIFLLDNFKHVSTLPINSVELGSHTLRTLGVKVTPKNVIGP